MTDHTEETLIAVYERLYAIQGQRKHPSKVRAGKPVMIGRYGEPTARDSRFMRFILKNVPSSATVHDAGCGRGAILRELLGLGYDASGSDCAAPLFSQDLHDLPAAQIPYSSLHVLGEDRFDCVISNDVLEHMVDEEAVKDAISNLVFITRGLLLVSVGIKPARNYPITYTDLGVDDLHQVQRSAGWWKRQIGPFVEEVEHHRGRVTYFYFGRKRRP